MKSIHNILHLTSLSGTKKSALIDPLWFSLLDCRN